MFGWQGDTLQKAMDNGCNLNTDCSKAGIHAQTSAQYSACKVQQQAPEAVDGCEYCSFFFLYMLTSLEPRYANNFGHNRAQGYANGRDVSPGLELLTDYSDTLQLAK